MSLVDMDGKPPPAWSVVAASLVAATATPVCWALGMVAAPLAIVAVVVIVGLACTARSER